MPVSRSQFLQDGAPHPSLWSHRFARNVLRRDLAYAKGSLSVKRIGIAMWCVALAVGFGAAGPAGAEGQAPACKRAEVNPVTGHVLCVNPLGAPVAPPPKADPCKTGEGAPDSSKDADFTFRPTCTEEDGSA